MAVPVSPPPISTKVLDSNGLFVSSWAQTLANWWTSMRTPANVVAPPAHSDSPGLPGQIAYDTNFFYACVSANEWKGVAWTKINF
jgi:hypothetical protein